jgi:hypothetical protein
MDALTFGSKVLLRHLTFSEARYKCIVWILAFSVSEEKTPTVFCHLHQTSHL